MYSEFTPDELKRIEDLSDQLIPVDFVLERAGPGNTKLYYVSADYVINTLNKVFGRMGWKSEYDTHIDEVKDVGNGQFTVQATSKTTITLKDGTSRAATSTQTMTASARTLADVKENVQKTAESDALKRAARYFLFE